MAKLDWELKEVLTNKPIKNPCKFVSDYPHRAGQICPRIFRSGIILVSACNQPGGDGSRGLLGQPGRAARWPPAEGKVDPTGGTVAIARPATRPRHGATCWRPKCSSFICFSSKMLWNTSLVHGRHRLHGALRNREDLYSRKLCLGKHRRKSSCCK